MSPQPLTSVRALPLKDLPTAAPQLRFAVRNADGTALEHDGGARHALAGAGKLVLALGVATLAEQHSGLLGQRLILTADHRGRARTGTLRSLGSDLQLTVDDATALIVGTGDGACALALLEHLPDRGIDIVGTAQHRVTDLGLTSTTLTGTEPEVYADGRSWGEGLVGQTTPADLCTLLERLLTADATDAGPPTADASTTGPVSATAARRVLHWMATVFEPAGLASALPGVGPRTVPHHTLAGWESASTEDHPAELTEPADGEPHGYTSVLILPAEPADPAELTGPADDEPHATAGRGAAVVAAHHPPTHPDRTRATGREVSAALGTLGLAVHSTRPRSTGTDRFRRRSVVGATERP